MLKKQNFYFIFILFFVLAPSAFACPTITTSRFITIKQMATKLGQYYGNQKVLLVFDFDDTLLKFERPKSFVLWHTWPERLTKNIECFTHLTSSNVEMILRMQNIFLYLTPMQPVEKDIPAIIKALQKQQFKTIILTDRNFHVYPNTQECLVQNQLDFSSHTPILAKSFPRYSTPYLNAPPVFYASGILFIAGGKKGLVLKSLMQHTRKNIKAIIMIDDKIQNLKNVDENMRHTPYQVVTIHYTHAVKTKQNNP